MEATYRSETDTRTLADGTVQKWCEHEHCWVRWFDVSGTGRPARFCSTNCRVAQHRLVKAREQAEADRIARELALAAANHDYDAALWQVCRQALPANSRASDAAVWELVAALRASKFVAGPFEQTRLGL